MKCLGEDPLGSSVAQLKEPANLGAHHQPLHFSALQVPPILLDGQLLSLGRGKLRVFLLVFICISEMLGYNGKEHILT